VSPKELRFNKVRRGIRIRDQVSKTSKAKEGAPNWGILKKTCPPRFRKFKKGVWKVG